MQKNTLLASIIGIIFISMLIILAWFILFVRGKQFALRNPLRKVDAIIVLAGTRGNTQFQRSPL